MQTLDLVRVAFALVAGYFIGGIPFGILVTRLIGGTDPRTIGSGRTGGANVSRAVGFRWAAVSGLLDVVKASVAVLLVVAIGGDAVPQVLAALAAIVGHSLSPFIGLHGGRGVAPATGGA
ncbi:MAG TPA: glycerol-3-phosphate acyltransferase, partial [Terriglobales bacterium]|nr:glycerol-3-phosphate acyltransferase [Terriglobales bacterium]